MTFSFTKRRCSLKFSLSSRALAVRILNIDLDGDLIWELCSNVAVIVELSFPPLSG